MDNIIITLLGEPTTIVINRKKIKNMYLKVCRDMSIVITAPLRMTVYSIKKFVNQKVDWIEKQLKKEKERGGSDYLKGIKTTSSAQILGERLLIVINQGKKEIKRIDNCVIIMVPDVNDDNQIDDLYSKWWRQNAEMVFDNLTDKFMPIFAKHNIKKPTIVIKKMTTLWGTCSRAKKQITLNEYLLKFDIRFIEYIILHELTHFLYSGHQKNFYDFVTIHMPDWKERKKLIFCK